MKVYILFFLLFSITILAQNCVKKDDGNPSCCFYLNAVTEQIFDSYYQQYFVDMYALSEKRFAVILRYFNGASLEKRDLEGDQVILFDFDESDDKQAKTLIEQVRTNKNLEKGKTLDRIFGSTQTHFNSLGNLVPITFGDSNIQKRFVLGMKVPLDNDTSKSEIYFSTLRMDLSEKQKPYTMEEGIKYKYPLIGIEKYYDRDGEQIGVIDHPDETYNQIETSNVDNTQLQVKAFFTNPTSQVEFVTLVANKGSIKLIKYTAGLEEGNAKITEVKTTGKIIVPYVIDTEFEKPLGGLLYTSHTGSIYVVTHLLKDQYKAFKTEHAQDYPVQFEWPENKKKVAVFMKFSKDDLKVELIDLLPLDYTTKHIKFTASSMDVRNDYVIVSGNTHNDYYARSPDDDQMAWFSRIHFQDDKVIDRKGGFLSSLNTEKGERFISNSVSFSAESDSQDKFVIGGKIGSYLGQYKYDGKASLVQILESKNKNDDEKGLTKVDVLYNIKVGQENSNAVEIIRRATRINSKDTQKEILIFGNEMNAPTTAPPEDESQDTSRSVQAGIWLIDCAPTSVLLETIVTTGFFIFFALCATVLTITVLFYSSLAMVKFLTKKYKKKNSVVYEKM